MQMVYHGANWRDDGEPNSKKKALEIIHLHLPIWQHFSFLCRNRQLHSQEASWFLSHSDLQPIHCSVGWAIKAIPCPSRVQWQPIQYGSKSINNNPDSYTYALILESSKPIQTMELQRLWGLSVGLESHNTKGILDFMDHFTNKVCHANERSECQPSGQIPRVMPPYIDWGCG